MLQIGVNKGFDPGWVGEVSHSNYLNIFHIRSSETNNKLKDTSLSNYIAVGCKCVQLCMYISP